MEFLRPPRRLAVLRPVKLYKKLVASIFPKFNCAPKERNLLKLCEYAAKNPAHIPEITMLIEEQFHKGLQRGDLKIVSFVMGTYSKLLSRYGKQMAYFAASLLTLTQELLDPSIEVCLQIIGCQTLTYFIYGQMDRSYATNIDSCVRKVCKLALENKELELRSLKASCLHCLSAMLCYMDEFFRSSDDIGEVVHVILDNYESNEEAKDGTDVADCSTSARPPPENYISCLTREVIEKIEDPGILARHCLHNMALLGEESSSIRLFLGPMFKYFDIKHHWPSQQSLATRVLCDLCIFAENSGTQLLILKSVIRHMEHQNVANDAYLRMFVAQAAATLSHQIRFGPNLSDVLWVVDLVGHLSKSLQVRSSWEADTRPIIELQFTIRRCLLNIANGIDHPRSLFNVMVLLLENTPSVGVIAQAAAMGSILILADVMVVVYYNSVQVFPEVVVDQLLKVMLQSERKARILAHHIFSILLSPNSWSSGFGSSLTRTSESSVMYGVYSIIVAAHSFSEQPRDIKINEDQISPILCSLWLQIMCSDNLASNFEAICNAYRLTLTCSDIESTRDSLIQVFQLPLSLRHMVLFSSGEELSPACRRAIVVTSSSMLLFGASRMCLTDKKLYDLLNFETLSDADPYLGINEDLQVYVKAQADLSRYGSATDNQEAAAFLSEISLKEVETKRAVLKIIAGHLCSTVKMEEAELSSLLSAPFSPDDFLVYYPSSI